MKTLYALCLVTLLAVLVDVVLFHSRTANAQNTGNYRVAEVKFGSFSLTGTVVGFSCVIKQNEQTFCFVATKE
jgi:hypothetical protein